MPQNSAVLERVEQKAEDVVEARVLSMHLSEPLEEIFPLTTTEKRVDDEIHRKIVERLKKPQPGSWTLGSLLVSTVNDLGVHYEIRIPPKRQGWGDCETIE